MRYKILHTALATSFGCLAMMAMAQTTVPVGNDYVYTVRASLSMASETGDAGRFNSESSPTVPMNVLEDVPRDMSSKQNQTECDRDLATGQTPAGCRRWLEIARTL
jgi:hypothetical protein